VEHNASLTFAVFQLKETVQNLSKGVFREHILNTIIFQDFYVLFLRKNNLLLTVNISVRR